MSGKHPHPEALYYHIAQDMLDAEKAEQDEFNKRQFIATSLVFSALCLETFINQEYVAHGETRKILEDRDKLPLETKWLMLPLLLESPETFNKGSEPFQTFRDLIQTRNNRLVHFKPLQEGDLHGGQARGEYFSDLVGNVALAQKYVECIGKMIKKLAELTKGKTSEPHFLGASRYLSTIWVDMKIPIDWSENLTSRSTGRGKQHRSGELDSLATRHGVSSEYKWRAKQRIC